MSRLRRYYGLNQLHFIIASTYRRARLFDSIRFKRNFVETLDTVHSALCFKVMGYRLRPEHFHVLTWPSPHADPSAMIRPSKNAPRSLL